MSASINSSHFHNNIYNLFYIISQNEFSLHSTFYLYQHALLQLRYRSSYHQPYICVTRQHLLCYSYKLQHFISHPFSIQQFISYSFGMQNFVPTSSKLQHVPVYSPFVQRHQTHPYVSV